MTLRNLFIFVILISFHYGYSHDISLNFQLVDKESGHPIPEAHVFISNASIGTISDDNGICQVAFSSQEKSLATSLPIDYVDFSDIVENETSDEVGDTLTILKNLIGTDRGKSSQALLFLDKNWSNGYIAPLLDIIRLTGDEALRLRITDLLKEHVPEMPLGYFDGIQWLWQSEPNHNSYYYNFKGYLYKFIDESFQKYFLNREDQADIRLDEIVWGGVLQDGIPPLRSPKMIDAFEANYLSDSDVVFGLVINGQASAYPQRILAWHEFFTDDIEGKSIAGVYCTLCGTVIIYDTEHNGINYNLGTSGFLYRSNKLMYDLSTQSLWSTIEGKPVVGPLIGQGIELDVLPVETTTWGEWRNRYADTKVLSLDTGHDRNYDEGQAYKDYYSNDNLMFPVPKHDDRLANKARVLIPRIDKFDEFPLAISIDYLRKKKIHQDQISDQNILVVSEKNGASKVYAIEHQSFRSYSKGILKDDNGNQWEVTTKSINGPNNERLSRLPAHETFWFAWYNVFPSTRLVK